MADRTHAGRTIDNHGARERRGDGRYSPGSGVRCSEMEAEGASLSQGTWTWTLSGPEGKAGGSAARLFAALR